MKSAVFLVLVLFLAAGIVFAGGGGQNNSSSGSKELNITFSGSPQPAEKEYMIDVMAKNFEKKYGVKVNVDFVLHADSHKKIEAEQDTGKIVSDLIFVDTANIAPYVNKGWTTDLAGMIHPGTTLTDMYDGVTTKGGVRLFVPTNFDIYILAAHVDSLKYLPRGVTKQNVIDGITWEQYVEWAINIAKGEGVGKAMMPASTQSSQLLYPMAGMGMAYGAGFPDFTSPGFKKGLDLIAKLSAGNAFYPEMDQYNSPTDPMRNGDVWLTFAHMAHIGIAYTAAPNEWIIGAAPKGSKGAGSTAGAWCWGILKGALHQDLAKLWIDYVTTPEVNYDYCVNFGEVLSPINEVAPLLRPENVVMIAGSKMLGNTIVSGVPSTEYSDWNAVKMLYIELFNEVRRLNAVPGDSFLQAQENKCKQLKL